MPTYEAPVIQPQEDEVLRAAKDFMKSPSFGRRFLQNANEAMRTHGPDGAFGDPYGSYRGGPPPARPSLHGMSERDLIAGALTAEGAGLEDMLAIGGVLKNRLNSPRYPGDYRSVILQPGQISAFNAVTGYAGGEGANTLWANPTADAYSVADYLLSNGFVDPTGGATHYHTPAVRPAWTNDSFRQLPGTAHLFGRGN